MSRARTESPSRRRPALRIESCPMDELRRLAEAVCGGRVVSTLEGGYDLTALGESAAAHVGVLMD